MKKYNKFTRIGNVNTNNGAKYIERMCKHFQHKVKAGWIEHSGWVEFAEGTCKLDYLATDTASTIHSSNNSVLRFCCQSDSEQYLQEIVDTIDRHLSRFSKAEELVVTWAQ